MGTLSTKFIIGNNSESITINVNNNNDNNNKISLFERIKLKKGKSYSKSKSNNIEINLENKESITISNSNIDFKHKYSESWQITKINSNDNNNEINRDNNNDINSKSRISEHKSDITYKSTATYTSTSNTMKFHSSSEYYNSWNNNSYKKMYNFKRKLETIHSKNTDIINNNDLLYDNNIKESKSNKIIKTKRQREYHSFLTKNELQTLLQSKSNQINNNKKKIYRKRNSLPTKKLYKSVSNLDLIIPLKNNKTQSIVDMEFEHNNHKSRQYSKSYTKSIKYLKKIKSISSTKKDTFYDIWKEYIGKRVVFLSVIELHRCWKSIPDRVLSDAIFLFPLNRDEILANKMKLQIKKNNVLVDSGIIEDRKFINLLKKKDEQGLCFWMKNDYTSYVKLRNTNLNTNNLDNIAPFWIYFSDKLRKIKDITKMNQNNQTKICYKSLNLKKNWWKHVYGNDKLKDSKFGAEYETIINEIENLSMRYKPMMEIIVQSNPTIEIQPQLLNQKAEHTPFVESGEGWKICVDYDDSGDDEYVGTPMDDTEIQHINKLETLTEINNHNKTNTNSRSSNTLNGAKMSIKIRNKNSSHNNSTNTVSTEYSEDMDSMSDYSHKQQSPIKAKTFRDWKTNHYVSENITQNNI